MKKLISGLALVTSLIFIPSTFADTVTVDGQSYSCTNSCNVETQSDGSYIISDCCGGYVDILPTPDIPAPDEP